MKQIRYSLRALALLAGYPDPGLREALPQLLAAIDAEAAVPAARRRRLHAFAAALAAQPALEAEARYVETFDRGRATSLHLFEHVHGDSRERGQALVDLLRTYEGSGLRLAPGELPDHLSVVLEFASTQPPRLARDFLAETGAILGTLHTALAQRASGYADVIAAVLELAGQPVPAPGPMARAAPEPVPEPDDDWAEPPAFDGCSAQGQARPDDVQPIHFVRHARNAPGSGQHAGRDT